MGDPGGLVNPSRGAVQWAVSGGGQIRRRTRTMSGGRAWGQGV